MRRKPCELKLANVVIVAVTSARDDPGSRRKFSPTTDKKLDLRSRQRGSDSPRRRKASEVAAREIAGEAKGSPRLVRITRLDSTRRSPMVCLSLPLIPIVRMNHPQLLPHLHIIYYKGANLLVILISYLLLVLFQLLNYYNELQACQTSLSILVNCIQETFVI